MLNPRRGLQGERAVAVAVAVDKDKGSQNALKWATGHILTKGETVVLIHVNQLPPPTVSPIMGNDDVPNRQEPDSNQPNNDLFLPFRVFCSRRDVLWEVVTLQDHDIAKALIEYVLHYRIGTLVLGASSRSGISRLFMKNDVPTCVLKGAPAFCNVYVISKGKIASIRAASLPLRSTSAIERLPHNFNGDSNFVSPLSRVRAADNRVQDEVSVLRTDISFVSSGRLSTDSTFFAFYDNLGGSQRPQRPSKCFTLETKNSEPFFSDSNLDDFNPTDELSASAQEENRALLSLQNTEDMEEKMRRLELQMKQTMDMYHAACKEALREKRKTKELQLLKIEDEKRLDEAQRAKEDALATAEKEKATCKAAIEAAKAAQKKAERETRKRIKAERKALKEAAAKKMLMLDSLSHPNNNIVPQYQSLLHILVVLSIFYLYFGLMK